ncbi:cytoskeletal protein CcmA (bactofilin family) [Peribacillus deserti]|uniref:Cytoskeletal protein CcmA (Bactofilin family) n=1 Tax=Peribacillus deserti TaxID=673318 RepID=A0ABS2QJS4_9BACI|nr:polymer-forming cytoskeletal protein [Peribacillus deserti]MBM7693403.1 cytoskeletal protein CcmA (bactofilin family) [Peribacillus deserti]
MKTETKYPLKINGSMTVPGGAFTEVHINGSGKITSDFCCDSYHVNGQSHVIGNITAEEVTVNGKADVQGNLTTKEIVINGKADVTGNIQASDIQIHGNLNIEGNVAADDFVSKGKTTIEGNCEAEDFTSKGIIHISKMLNADSIEIKLNADSYIKEIGGEEIKIRRESMANGLGKLISFLANPKSSTFTSDLIEGDEIYVEFTTAEIVRGNEVQIGPGCTIRRVEYRDELTVDPSSTIKETIQN